MKPEMAMIGMAVMGSNFAQNFARNGYPIALFNRTTAKTKAVYEACRNKPYADHLFPVEGNLKALVDVVGKTGTYFIMVKAGQATQTMIDELRPLLAPGAYMVDCANSYWPDTRTRRQQFEGTGIHFFGVGVSGGEEGALLGPAIMPGGGPREIYDARLKAPLEAVAAKAPQDGAPCVAYLGKHGAGHFVKMVHNAIEYGDMQLIAEAYDLMRGPLGMGPEAIADVFGDWNKGVLDSYLIEITAQALRQQDPHGQGYLVDWIVDAAQMKGTGTWTVKDSLALEAGVEPIPTIYAAVESRAVSAQRTARVELERLLPLAKPVKYEGDAKAFLKHMEQALYVAKIASYAQGLQLLKAADRAYDFGGLEIGEIARLWRAGCIIRARFLGDITQAYRGNPQLPNLIVAPQFRQVVAQGMASLVQVCAAATQAHIPLMAFDASKNYLLQATSSRLPMNLTQLQRDFFGAHTYQRLDRPGVFHTVWTDPARPEASAD